MHLRYYASLHHRLAGPNHAWHGLAVATLRIALPLPYCVQLCHCFALPDYALPSHRVTEPGFDILCRGLAALDCTTHCLRHTVSHSAMRHPAPASPRSATPSLCLTVLCRCHVSQYTSPAVHHAAAPGSATASPHHAMLRRSNTGPYLALPLPRCVSLCHCRA